MLAEMLSFIYRLYAFISGVETPKADEPLRFGLLGASQIAPLAVINPAKSHPEVVIACVAARDRSRAEAYAKRHGIPTVHNSYQDIINDPSIDSVYIALPNALHYEWALRAVQAGKHVLLEKPSTSNSIEAAKLFNHPRVTASDAPVVLEAVHYRFHPAWQRFLSLIHRDPHAGPVKTATSQSYIPKGYFSPNDIRLNFAMSGGCLMDFASYNVSNLRQILRDQHPQVQTASFRRLAIPDTGAHDPRRPEQIDEAVTATYKSKTGAEGRIHADLLSTGGWPLLPSSWTRNWPSLGWPKCTVELEEKQLDNQEVGDGQAHFVQRTVTMYNHLMPHLYHSLAVEDKHSIRRGSQVVRSWTEKKSIQEYDWSDKSDGRQGAYWWPTYRYQLEEFVHRVKGRKGNGLWVDGQDSIHQMQVIDETYAKGGLEIRPTSAYGLPE